jgi:hypothetical protein
MSIDFRRLGTGDWVALVGTVLLLISLFLSWYSATGLNDLNEVITLKENIFGQFAGGFRILILITCIFIILYLFIRTMTPRGLRLPLPHRPGVRLEARRRKRGPSLVAVRGVHRVAGGRHCGSRFGDAQP